MSIVEDTTDKEYKNPSEILINLMDQFSSLEYDRSELIQKIVERAKIENVDPAIIRKMIEDKLRSRGLSDSTIRRALPNELKDKVRQEARSHRQDYSANRQTQEIEPSSNDEYVPPKTEQPTAQEQENIKEIEPQTPVVPQIPIAEDKDMTIEQLRERNRQRFLSAQTQQTTGSSTKISSIRTVYPVLLMHTEKGDYTVTLTVRLQQDDKATVDPVHRADLKKVSAVPTIKT